MENKTKPYLRNVSRTLVIWICEAFGLLLLIHFIPGLSVNSFAAAFAFVVVLGIVNAILWPILTRSTLRFLTYTFGIGALLLNALLVLAHKQISTRRQRRRTVGAHLNPNRLGSYKRYSRKTPDE